MPPTPPPNKPSEGSSPPSEPTPPVETPPANSPGQRAFPWFWLGTFIGTAISAGGLALAAWAWIFINEDLSPLISKTLTNSLERPVELGDVEDVTFGSIQVGPSKLGASDEDSTTVTADAVIVKFDLIETLLTSKLGLDLTIVKANGYLEQDEDKGWLNFDAPQDEDQDRRFEVRVDDVRVRESALTLVPLAIPSEPSAPSFSEPAATPSTAPVLPEPILIEQLNGQVNFDDVTVDGEDARRTRFEVSGDPAEGGEIVVKGEVQPIRAVVVAEGESGPDETNASNSNSAEDVQIQLATNLSIQADKAPLADILGFTLSTIKVPTDKVIIDSGRVSGTMDMELRPQQPVVYTGAVSLDDGDIDLAFLPLPFKKVDGQARFQSNEWAIDRLNGDYGEIAAVVEGSLDFNEGYDLNIVAKDVSVEEFTDTIDLEIPVPTTGKFDAVALMSGPIANPKFSGSVEAIAPLQVDKLTFTSATSAFLFQNQQLFLNDITATPNTGGSLRGSGQVRLGQGSPFTFQLAGRSLPARELAKLYGIEPNFKLGLIAADATVTGRDGNISTTIDWQAPTAAYPGSGTIDINGDTVAFRDSRFQLGGGTVTGSGTLVSGLWDAAINLANVDLGTLSENLRGDVSGQFSLSGNTADTRIGAILGSGNVAFSNGLATFNRQFDSFNEPLTAQVAWNGEKIQVIQARSDRLTANGTITPIFDSGFDGLERFDLNISAQDYALAELPFQLPSALDLSGRTNFTGTLAGTPEAPELSGNAQVADLIVNSLPFNPLLTGSVNYAPDRGLDLNLIGSTDKIALDVGPFGAGTVANSSGIPALNFDIDWRDTFARGQTQGDLLNVQAGNFPLSALNFPPAGAGNIGKLRGTLTTADLAVNLANQTLEGDIAIDRLGLGYIGAGRLVGQVRYADSLATLTSGELILNDNLYTLSGSLALGGPAPVYSANIETQQGNVQNILTALSIYSLEDFRRGLAAPDWIENPASQSELDVILATSDTGNSQTTLLNQLRRLAEIQALLAEAKIAEEKAPLPPLRELSGPFAGDIQLKGSGGDFQLDFDLAGANWQWGQDYSAEEVIAKGSLTPNVLTLAPVRFASTITVPVDATGKPLTTDSLTADSLTTDSLTAEPELPADVSLQPRLAELNLAGQLVYGRNSELTSNLQAIASNIKVEDISDILEIPLDISGFAEARATLSGTLANPQLRGSAELDAATINDTPIQQANAQFLYQNARLSLFSALTATTPEQPLTLSAQIPYAFNFMDVQADSQDIQVDVNVKNEGLALLNIFTDQVAWESGTGEVSLKVGGTLFNPKISGFATLDDAILSAKVLPEPLTNVAGRAIFSGEQIIVQSLQGSFSDGQLTAAGTFPLLYPIITGSQLSELTAPDPAESMAPAGSPEQPPDQPPDQPPAEDFNPLFPQPLAADRPLTLNLQSIALNLQDLYSGGVNGQIIVGGSALLNGPQIGGEVILSQGQVLLPDGSNASSSAAGTLASNTPASAIPNSLGTEGGITPNFRDLRLTLGDSIRVVQGNLLNFVADGTLVLNGPPTDLEPEGVINLKSGRVNLFTTLFRLRGRNNTATFSSETGLQNPFLDVSLRASVPEVNSTGPIASTPFASAEVADTSNNGFDNPGSLRTIRVRADVEGPANAIFDNLELSSSPSRSESELIGLIGGGFVTALESTVGSLGGGGDNFGGLINLVSGTILTSVQDFVGTTLSLSEFRLFPVTAASRERSAENNENGLDIGAAVGFDVTDTTSLSVTKILTDSSNPEFGVNYRLTDALTVRSATNLDDINQVLLEYEIRF
ncbi:MAG: translocation/assembly module TamB domain-containing protein [Phormidesmis sp.]